MSEPAHATWHAGACATCGRNRWRCDDCQRCADCHERATLTAEEIAAAEQDIADHAPRRRPKKSAPKGLGGLA